MSQKHLITKVQEWVKTYFQTNENRKITYHNLEHTEGVVEACKLLGDASNLSNDDLENLIIAAYFHDTGCWDGNWETLGHEVRSCSLATEFLKHENISIGQIETINNLIMSTQMPQKPETFLEQILCDADLFHFAANEFLQSSLKLKTEMVLFGKFEGSTIEWYQKTLELMAKHRYFSTAAKRLFDEKKKENMVLIQEEIRIRKDQKLLKAKKKERNRNRPDRGIETMFRIASKNHIQLSSIADNKANILISVNSIIISVLVSILFRKFEEFPNLIVPGIILLFTNLSTIIYAILATRPNITHGKISQQDIEEKTSNLLYFGNFHEMVYSDYENGMKKMMQEADFLYGSLIRDIFYLGKVLAKKYELLRKSYTVFMYGLVISSIAFAIASVLVN